MPFHDFAMAPSLLTGPGIGLGFPFSQKPPLVFRREARLDLFLASLFDTGKCRTLLAHMLPGKKCRKPQRHQQHHGKGANQMDARDCLLVSSKAQDVVPIVGLYSF